MQINRKLLAPNCKSPPAFICDHGENVTIKSVVYPEEIAKRIARLGHARSGESGNAMATTPNFSCGSFVRFSLSIDTESHLVADAVFESNGCGFMLANADVLAESVTGKRLIDLHGLNDAELHSIIGNGLGEIPSERRECVAACIEALRAVFADFRARQIEEFRGEKALICTCFGVSEETIENLIVKDSLTTVGEVTDNCNAGSGCGSCRMLIQEMLDGRGRDL